MTNLEYSVLLPTVQPVLQLRKVTTGDDGSKYIDCIHVNHNDLPTLLEALDRTFNVKLTRENHESS